ncbi:Sodium:solute symporter family-domain-containing protein [Ilyonectria robusta]|uniref:Sodium:solute symporter family-domain-containing protein n=1 Tax=Ilyonectria robusta TaxID=1079257 RepID=UPI001E8ED282|nr:Sodium:solute symporter family-domain-containing protein [Ilyonectria robusta]KAH8677037.1 Sodium:solute symporter family-domain-containing protein [Ilyonectria robusta]
MAGSGTPALSQGVGYGIVLGVGIAFAIFMISLTHILKRFNGEVQTSEMFTTAGRSVKSGLVAAAVVSSWTWAATLLQSSGVCYRYGVSGPFWYASGATVQILLFATLAIMLKKRAPNAHTFLEVIKARYGSGAHFTFIVFGLVTNVLVSLMLISGGAATINALTGMHTIAAIFLLPVGVVAYTFIGGLKATFITDFIHGAVVLIIIIIFALTAYATSDVLGSPGAVYDLLVEASKAHPVEGNEEGSYLTMRSQGGVIFFIINIVGNFGTVFLDNGYYNKAIAAHPVHALPGYIMGGLAWFAIPWLTATALGLSALALESNPRFPTYPDRMTEADISAGLVLPYASVALLGKGGAIATLLVVFLAVTSSFNSELVATSSIFTYDIYRTYFRPNASGKSLIWMSHACMVVYALVICCISVGLWHNGISMGYLYLLMGVLISAAVLPATLTLIWNGQNRWAATISPILGTSCAIIAWLVTASKSCGKLDVVCTGSNNPMLAGNITALLSPVVFIPVLCLIFGVDKYDWQSMMDIRQADDHEMVKEAGVDEEAQHRVEAPQQVDFEEEQIKLARAFKIASSITIVMTVSLLVLWPMPMFASRYIFSKSFFTGWVSVGMIWIFCSFLAVGIYPLWESRATIARVCTSMVKGKRPNAIMQGEPALTDGPSGTVTPEKKGLRASVE